MAKDINQAVREVCLSFPEAEEYLSHGSPNFRLKKGKTFATYVVNHHGDGRIALWLNAPEGAQGHYTGAEPRHFFVPPYVGPRGWLGVNLDTGVSWKRVAELVREAYEKVAPAELSARIGRTIEIVPPKATLKAEQFDPMQSARARQVLEGVRRIWGDWPDVREEGQFGFPVWRVGKKTFAQAYHHQDALHLGFWVGVDRQGLLLTDRRYRPRPYMGHMGWIALDVTRSCDWAEVRNLALDSYRHFALRRTLAKLEAELVVLPANSPARTAQASRLARAPAKAARKVSRAKPPAASAVSRARAPRRRGSR
jgi:predicted DNA-binding protein (MmcQ/YjbR family)